MNDSAARDHIIAHSNPPLSSVMSSPNRCFLTLVETCWRLSVISELRLLGSDTN